MTETQEQKLVEIVGKTIKFEGKNYDVQSFKENQRNIVVFTKQRSFVFQLSQLDAWLENITVLQEIVNTSTSPTSSNKKENKVSLQIYEATESQKEVQQSLLDMLNKVKQDPKAIPQAKAVCEIANTMVNIEKSQIQLIKLAKRNY